MRTFLLYAITVLGWGTWTVVMRMSGMKSFVGAAIAGVVTALVTIVPFASNAPQELVGITGKALLIGVLAGILNGAGTVGFQVLRYETTDFLRMNLTVIVSFIAVNIIGTRILIGDLITTKKALAILCALLTAILAS